MTIIIKKPVTPGQRHMSVIDYSQISKRKAEKRLTGIIKNPAGRNNQGKITVRHRGGGNKLKYRFVDFKGLDKLNITGKIKSIEYDPNRNCFIALVYYTDGEKRYILAPNGLKAGDTVVTAEKTKAKIGNRMKLKNIPFGIDIYNLEINPGRGGQLVRSAGNCAKLISLEGDNAQIQLPSGETRLIQNNCYASIGILSNEDYANVKLGKAGRTRFIRRRPHVRGKVMNPIDHPHGGGEGNQPIGLKHPKTPWGAPALGKLTRRKKYSDNSILKRRKKK